MLYGQRSRAYKLEWLRSAQRHARTLFGRRWLGLVVRTLLPLPLLLSLVRSYLILIALHKPRHMPHQRRHLSTLLPYVLNFLKIFNLRLKSNNLLCHLVTELRVVLQPFHLEWHIQQLTVHFKVFLVEIAGFLNGFRCFVRARDCRLIIMNAVAHLLRFQPVVRSYLIFLYFVSFQFYGALWLRYYCALLDWVEVVAEESLRHQRPCITVLNIILTLSLLHLSFIKREFQEQYDKSFTCLI